MLVPRLAALVVHTRQSWASTGPWHNRWLKSIWCFWRCHSERRSVVMACSRAFTRGAWRSWGWGGLRQESPHRLRIGESASESPHVFRVNPLKTPSLGFCFRCCALHFLKAKEEGEQQLQGGPSAVEAPHRHLPHQTNRQPTKTSLQVPWRD